MGFTRYDAAAVLDIRHETARRHPTPRRKQNRQSRDESLEESDNLPDSEVLAQKIVEDLEAALEQFREIAAELGADVLNREIAINCSGDPVNCRVGLFTFALIARKHRSIESRDKDESYHHP